MRTWKQRTLKQNLNFWRNKYWIAAEWRRKYFRQPLRKLRNRWEAYQYDRKHPYIKIPNLAEGAWYRGEGRNFDYGKWNGKGFVGVRDKFGTTREATELHWDADPHYGTFRPYEGITNPARIDELNRRHNA